MFAGLFWAKRIKYSNILFFLVALVLGLLFYICKKQMGGTYWNLKKLFKLTSQTKNASFSNPSIFLALSFFVLGVYFRYPKDLESEIFDLLQSLEAGRFAKARSGSFDIAIVAL